MSNLIKIDAEYKAWIGRISEQFKRSQIKAAVKVNDEMLRFYWSLGRDLSDKSKKAKYGSGFYKSVSEDLRNTFPNVHSFSETNLRYMQWYFELYSSLINSPQVGVDSSEEENLPQVGEDFRSMIFCIPWGHNKLIIDKCKGNPDKALFYVQKTLENNWSRAVLLNFLDTDLYDRQGKAISNFRAVLPDTHSDLAQSITKDPYNFDFLTIREKYDEKELKDALSGVMWYWKSR